MSQREEHGAHNHNDAGFDERGPVLQVGTLSRAPDVDRSHDRNHNDGNESLRYGRNGNYTREILAERARERRDGAAGDHEKQTPTVEKCREAAESVADVAVESAGFGIACGQFRVSERAEEREKAADNPDEHRNSDGPSHLAQNRAGRAKNTGADDGANEQKEEVPKAKRADEFNHGAACSQLFRTGKPRCIITGDLEPSRRTWRNGNRGRHKAEHENNQGQERPEPPLCIQRRSIVNRRNAQRTHDEQQRAPNVPTLPKMQPAESNHTNGQQERKNAMRAHTQRTQNVPAVQLRHGHEIERSD